MTSTEQRTATQTIRQLVQTAEAGVDALQQIHSYLREAREERGMTQNKLSVLMGVGPSVISGIEAGKTPVTLDRARKILEAISNGG